MLISVIIPFYKEFELIPRAIISVFSQVLPEGVSAEIIIGDDSGCGSDKIWDVLNFKHKWPIKIAENHKENCAGYARNAAIEKSKGDYLAFLDSDDYWVGDKLARQLDWAKQGYNFICTAYQFEGTETIVLPKSNLEGRYGVLLGNIGTSSVLISRNLIEGHFFSNRRSSQDVELWYELSQKIEFRYIGLRQNFVRYAPSGRTSNKFVQAVSYWRLLSDFNIPAVMRMVLFFNYFVRGIFNHYLKGIFHGIPKVF
jgi:teichuronic acid biosynthesis glycosyltransferase TuaG